MSALAFTARDKHACAKRELDMRNSVYRRRVVDGRMSKETADREIALMTAIVADYAVAMANEKRGDLFDRGLAANDRGFEPIGDVAARVINGLAREIEGELAATSAAVTEGEARIARLRRLGEQVRQPHHRSAAE